MVVPKFSLNCQTAYFVIFCAYIWIIFIGLSGVFCNPILSSYCGWSRVQGIWYQFCIAVTVMLLLNCFQFPLFLTC